MKKIPILAILVTMLVALGGCFWGYPERGGGEGRDHHRDGGYDRGGERDHDRDGGHEERERR